MHICVSYRVLPFPLTFILIHRKTFRQCPPPSTSGDHLRQFSVLDFINLSITHDSKRTAQYDTIWNAANGPFPVVMLRGRGGRSQGYYSIARHHIAPPTRPVRSCTASDPPSPSASLLMALFAMEIVIVAPACELPS